MRPQISTAADRYPHQRGCACVATVYGGACLVAVMSVPERAEAEAREILAETEPPKDTGHVYLGWLGEVWTHPPVNGGSAHAAMVQALEPFVAALDPVSYLESLQ